MPGDPGLAAIGVHDRREHPHGGRLARAVGPNETEDLAFLDGQREVVEGSKAVKFLDKMFSANHTTQETPNSKKDHKARKYENFDVQQPSLRKKPETQQRG